MTLKLTTQHERLAKLDSTIDAIKERMLTIDNAINTGQLNGIEIIEARKEYTILANILNGLT
jgi:hypothetical protein